MSDVISESPVLEQEICVTCGLCCDGTLFDNAVLQAGEQGNLPGKIEQQYGKEGDYEYFRLPCAYFCGKCTIYDQPRASICSAFRCQLLRDFETDKITQTQALQKVSNALKLRTEIYELYRQTFGQEYPMHFRNLLLKVSEAAEAASADDPNKTSIDFLRTKCTIFETLLIKNFKSLKNFERMIGPPTVDHHP